MAINTPFRTVLPYAWKLTLAMCCVLTSLHTLPAQFAGQSPAGSPPPPGYQRPGNGNGNGNPNAHPNRPQQEHLAQWMDRHSTLPLSEQQSALEREPGFRDLPPQTQQRMRDRLTQLNNMPPEQRRRLLERTEEMEQLTPPQRQQVRGAMQQLSNLPVDRRRLVARAFRDIREMPVPQRQVVLNSDRLRAQFSELERATLANLLAVEPYLPVHRPYETPSYGK